MTLSIITLYTTSSLMIGHEFTSHLFLRERMSIHAELSDRTANLDSEPMHTTV